MIEEAVQAVGFLVVLGFFWLVGCCFSGNIRTASTNPVLC